MTTTIAFKNADTLIVTVESGCCATDFNLLCKDQEHADKLAVDTLVAIANNFFNNY